MNDLKPDFLRSLPGGQIDDSTYEQIEDALDKINAPLRSPGGQWLTLRERVLAIGEEIDQLRPAPHPDGIDL
jgi:hypothetical protein